METHEWRNILLDLHVSMSGGDVFINIDDICSLTGVQSIYTMYIKCVIIVNVIANEMFLITLYAYKHVI